MTMAATDMFHKILIRKAAELDQGAVCDETLLFLRHRGSSHDRRREVTLESAGSASQAPTGAITAISLLMSRSQLTES